MAYKGYTEKGKEASLKYKKDKQKRIPLDWLKDDFESRIEPGIIQAGYKTSTFIKEAVVEKLQRMNILDENGELINKN